MQAAIAAAEHDHDDTIMIAAVRRSCEALTAGAGAVFTTDTAGLWDAYLASFPEAERQVYNCNACRRFIETYGGLATVQDDGSLTPIMWAPNSELPFDHAVTFDGLSARIFNARVTGVFYSAESVWGLPRNFDAKRGKTWEHLHAIPPRALVYRPGALTPGQAMAAKREDLKTVAAALAEFKPAVIDEALRLLRADALARSEKFVAPLQWLRDLHDRPKGPRGHNLLWRAVALAPAGFCHPRAAVTGSLLEDIAAGMALDDIQRRFNAKLAPLRYQRPQAPPSVGNIKAAEALVEKLGIARSLERRFARLEELPLIWSPAAPAQPETAGGVFGHLTPKNTDAVTPRDLPTRTLTWEKFARTVLPDAEAIDIEIPMIGRFIALTTAEHADAPPILKWDLEDARNPVAWYVYPGGSRSTQWRLSAGAYCKVTGITRFPTEYGDSPRPELAQGVVLIIDGAVDQGRAGNALFPECLKAELHGVRATIEAYSRSAELGGRESASACGYDLRKDAADCRLRVKAHGGFAHYRIDRWD